MCDWMETNPQRRRGPLRALVFGAVLLAPILGSSPSRAQYPSWSFEIVEIAEVGPQAHIIRLVPAPAGLAYPRTCTEFVIHARFGGGVGVRPRDREVFSSVGYAKAIRVLRQIQLADELVKFGSFETGFGAIDPELPCEVASRGLAVLNDVDGTTAVYSVY